jgi:hypothetical protein
MSADKCYCRGLVLLKRQTKSIDYWHNTRIIFITFPLKGALIMKLRDVSMVYSQNKAFYSDKLRELVEAAVLVVIMVHKSRYMVKIKVPLIQ